MSKSPIIYQDQSVALLHIFSCYNMYVFLFCLQRTLLSTLNKKNLKNHFN